MRASTSFFWLAVSLGVFISSAAAQAGPRTPGKLSETLASTSSTQTVEADEAKGEAQGPSTRDSASPNDPASPDKVKPEPKVLILLAGGGRIEVDDATESVDGVWYRRGNITTFLDGARVDRVVRPVVSHAGGEAEVLQGTGTWRLADAAKVETFFASKFSRPLPIAAFGQSELHTRWGWDHRQGMDVGLHPDSPEGAALIKFLRSEGIPFLAFRRAIPGVATGPHIHIGHASPRLRAR